MEESEGVEPLRGNDLWYIRGNLHGVHVSATFNTYENITLSVFDKRVSYKGSMKDTLNNFIETYREGGMNITTVEDKKRVICEHSYYRYGNGKPIL